ncbi:HmuY family protein [uncultured Weeksella sp.]|uniref:T9SS type A sorting domain-containing protein n=1 Tax=uncultured Weeksella sp. TaxID=1161389 RepID=UPI00259B8F7E|nr:HmuY family protein [uncultured Weeksella sp.]
MNKKFTLFSTTFLIGLSLQAQIIQGEISMGQAYQNDVYFGLENQTQFEVNRQEWDLAFFRKSMYGLGIRVNDTKGIQVFEASNSFSDWNSISPSNESTWDPLYNSVEKWDEGAFNHGSATYGWGEYDMVTHHVNGKIIFVLKYDNGDYIKLRIDKLAYGTYTFTFSKWENGTWSADERVNIEQNTSQNRIFNYYNLSTKQIVNAEAEQDKWEMKFTKYQTPLPYEGGTIMYPVTGILQSDLVKVAKTEAGNPSDDDAYKAEINSIGYDWKTFNGSTYSLSNLNYFIKNTNTNRIYRLNFTGFEGSSTGKITFDYEDVTSSLSISDIRTSNFDVYTIQSEPKTIQVVFNGQFSTNENMLISVFNLNGQIVHQESYRPSAQFTTKKINLSKLGSGIYIVNIESNGIKKSKKIALR